MRKGITRDCSQAVGIKINKIGKTPGRIIVSHSKIPSRSNFVRCVGSVEIQNLNIYIHIIKVGVSPLYGKRGQTSEREILEKSGKSQRKTRSKSK